MVKRYLPEAYGAAVNLYDGDSLIILHPDPNSPYATTTSQQGVHQGCVFGSIFFCIAVRDALSLLTHDLQRAHPSHSLSAFADDVTLHVRPEYAAAALHAAYVRLGRCNLPVQTKKTEVFCSDGHWLKFNQQPLPRPAYDPRALEDGYPGYKADDWDIMYHNNIRYEEASSSPPPPTPQAAIDDIQKDDVWRQDGIVVAGTPIGTPAFIVAAVRAKTDKALNSATIARTYASDPSIPYAVQGGNALFRLCVMTKLSHLARVTIFNPAPRATLHGKDPVVKPMPEDNPELRTLLSQTEDALYAEYLRMAK